MNRRTTFKTVTFIRWHSFTDTFLQTQCLSKVKYNLADTTKMLKAYAKQHIMKNL